MLVNQKRVFMQKNSESEMDLNNKNNKKKI